MSYEKPRSNWWYLLPILFNIIGGLISYFAIKNDDPKKAKYCLCIGLVLTLGFIGGIIGYFILRKEDPEKAKIFLYVGLILFGIGIAINLAILGSGINPLDPGFNVNI